MSDIPIIFVTAKTDIDDLARGFAAGAVDYITKPVKQPEVHARVANHLRIVGLIRQQREHLAALEQARGELQELNDAKDKFLSNLGREASKSSSASSAISRRASLRNARCTSQRSRPRSRVMPSPCFSRTCPMRSAPR